MSNLNELKPIHTLNPFGKFCCTIGHLPSSYMLSLSYEEQLLWFCDFLEKTVIPAVNGNAEAVREMQDLFVELKSYVDDYFTNLNVQTEINNKLDTMATDGTLDEIINQNIFEELNTQINTNTENIQTNTENIQTNSENIQTNSEDIQEIKDTIENFNKLVVFGDSWSDLNVTSAIWSQRVADVLNLTLHNFAVNGAGFVSPSSNLISSQITNFANDVNIKKDKVKYIVMMGGINDFRNEITSNDLASSINTCTMRLKELCPQAKILYVSNCQYPYTFKQSFYWVTLHNYLSTSNSIATLNLDGTIGRPLFNNANFFHLTENGYLFLARNIVASLTGGELIYYRNHYEYEDSDIKLLYSTQRVKDMVILSLVFTPKIENLSSKEITTQNNIISYYDSIDLFGGTGRSFNNFVAQISQNNINIASQDSLRKDFPYCITASIPISQFI